MSVQQKIKNNFLKSLLVPLLVVAVFIFPSVTRAFTITPNRLELAADPGTKLSSQFKVYNDSNQTETFYTSVQNFEAGDEQGNPLFNDTKTALVAWTSIKSGIVAKPKQEVVIPFEIDIPKDAEPGGYFAGLFASTLPTQINGGNVALGSRIGTLLLFRVNGDIPEGVNVVEFSTSSHARFFTGLPINFYYRFQNSGADRIEPLGDVIVKNIFGVTTKILNANAYDGNVLPKSIRRFETTWIRDGGNVNELWQTVGQQPKLGFFSAANAELQNFAFGPYVAHLNLAYGNVTAKSATASYTFFVFPWQLMLIVLIILIILFFILRVFVRRYNKYIIEQARRR